MRQENQECEAGLGHTPTSISETQEERKELAQERDKVPVVPRHRKVFYKVGTLRQMPSPFVGLYFIRSIVNTVF